MKEALAMLPAKSVRTYKGLGAHTDNNIIAGAPEVFHVQSLVSLSPAPKGWHRVAVLGAWMPSSDYIYRNTLLSIASKMSQCEHGCVGKRALGETKARHCLGRAGHAIRQGAATSRTRSSEPGFGQIAGTWICPRSLAAKRQQ